MKKIILIALMLIVTINTFSQERKVVRDFGIWVSVALQKKVHKNVRLDFDQQVRTFENSSRIDDYLADFGVRYTINKHFSLGANLRYTHDLQRFDKPENNIRYNLDLGFKIDIIKKLRFYYRLRYQQEFENFYRPTTDFNTGTRNRIKFRYKLPKKNRLYLSAELFRRFEKFRDSYFNNIRLCLGDEMDIPTGAVNVAFCYEIEPEASRPASFYFIKLGYVWKP
ncbi:MAG: DUF2490 domain-containing protein [Flavobacteriales bacterium]